MQNLLEAFVLLANFVLVPAIAYGSQLALGALGVTLIYAVLRFSNFAHGDTMALGTMVVILVTWWLQGLGVSLGPLPTALLALPFGIVAAALLALVTDRWVYRFYRKQRSDSVIFVIASVGVMFVYNALTRFVIGTDEQRFEDGARFVIRAPEFKALTGLDEGLAIRTSPGDHRRGDADLGGGAVLVPAEDPHRQVDARLFRQRGSGASLRHQPGPRGDDHLDPRGGARDHRRHALRARQVLPALHLLPAPAADLRGGHRRRGRPAARRHRRRLHHRLLRGDGDLRLQGLSRPHPARGLAAGGPRADARHRLQVRRLLHHPGGGAARQADRHLPGARDINPTTRGILLYVGMALLIVAPASSRAGRWR